MNEKKVLSPIERQRLQAATYFYYEADKLLELDLFNKDAALIKELMAAVIFAEDSAVSPHQLIQQIKEVYQRAEFERQKETENQNVYVATIGLDNVGKAVVSEYLKEKYGFEAHPLSDRIQDIALALNETLPLDRDTMHKTGKKVKNIFGDAILIRYAEALFYELGRPNYLVFDGIRVPGEAAAFKNLANNNTAVILIAIVTGEETEEADIRIRFQRSLNRKNTKDSTEFELYKQKSEREAGGIKEAMKYATHLVINRENQLDQTRAQIDAIMTEKGISPVSPESLPNSYSIAS